jgi:replication factor A2
MHGGSEFDGSAAAFMGGGFMPTQSALPSSSDSSSFSISKVPFLFSFSFYSAFL